MQGFVFPPQLCIVYPVLSEFVWRALKSEDARLCCLDSALGVQWIKSAVSTVCSRSVLFQSGISEGLDQVFNQTWRVTAISATHWSPFLRFSDVRSVSSFDPLLHVAASDRFASIDRGVPFDCIHTFCHVMSVIRPAMKSTEVESLI